MVLSAKKHYIYLIYSCLSVLTAVYELYKHLFNPYSSSFCQIFGKSSCFLPHGDYSIFTLSLTFSLIIFFFSTFKQIHLVIAQTPFTSEMLIFFTILLWSWIFLFIFIFSYINFYFIWLHICLELLYSPVDWSISMKCPSISLVKLFNKLYLYWY